MIRIDAIWLATESMDMRAGTETALARVIAVFGAAKPHCAYLFANRRANRMKVLVHDGVGVWLAARRLNQGKFHWPGIRHGGEVELDSEQLQALVLGLPWQRVGAGGVISMRYPPCVWPVYGSSSRACSGTIGGMTSSPNLDQMTRNSFVPWRHRRCSCSPRSMR